MQIYISDRNPFDEQDMKIYQARIDSYNKKSGPRVGDYIIMEDGHYHRFSHDWGDSLQTTDGEYGSSFYLDVNGYVSFSGGLKPSIKKKYIFRNIDPDTKEGTFWFFHHDWHTASNGVYFSAPVRVYKYDKI